MRLTNKGNFRKKKIFNSWSKRNASTATAAALYKIDFTKLLNCSLRIGELNEVSVLFKSENFFQDCVEGSPSGNLAYIANEPNLHVSGYIAQSNQTTAILLPLFNLTTHKNGLVDANISLTIRRLEETSKRKKVNKKTNLGTNNLHEQTQPQNTQLTSVSNFVISAQLNALERSLSTISRSFTFRLSEDEN